MYQKSNVGKLTHCRETLKKEEKIREESWNMYDFAAKKKELAQDLYFAMPDKSSKYRIFYFGRKYYI